MWHDGKTNENGQRVPPNNLVNFMVQHGHGMHQFAKEQTDVNYLNSRVVEEMENVIRFWWKKGAAGFRVDGINHFGQPIYVINHCRGGQMIQKHRNIRYIL